MSACSVEVVKQVGKYYNIPVGNVCLNTDKVLTTVVDKQNVEGFANIILRLISKSDQKMNKDQFLLSYQWLEHISIYANSAAGNPNFAKGFLEDINKALEKNSYLTGQFMIVADVAAYYVLYPLVQRLSPPEKESLIHLCRWLKHIQAQPNVCSNRPPLQLNTLNLSVLAPAAH